MAQNLSPRNVYATAMYALSRRDAFSGSLNFPQNKHGPYEHSHIIALIAH